MLGYLAIKFQHKHRNISRSHAHLNTRTSHPYLLHRRTFIATSHNHPTAFSLLNPTFLFIPLHLSYHKPLLRTLPSYHHTPPPPSYHHTPSCPILPPHPLLPHLTTTHPSPHSPTYYHPPPSILPPCLSFAALLRGQR